MTAQLQQNKLVRRNRQQHGAVLGTIGGLATAQQNQQQHGAVLGSLEGLATAMHQINELIRRCEQKQSKNELQMKQK